MEIKEIFLHNYIDTINELAVKKDRDIALYGIFPKTIVLKGKGQINQEYCTTNNIDVYNSLDFGGGIVSSVGDIAFIIFKHDGWDFGKDFLVHLKNYLISKKINANIDNNDVIIDGKYKVASYSSTNLGDKYIYTGFQISFNPDLDLINNICLKNSIKVPKGLIDYEISHQEILNLIYKYCN